MSELSPHRVYTADARGLKYCSWGIRAWCKRYGLDLKTLTTDGYPFEVFEKIGCEMGLKLVERVKNGRQ